MIAHLLRRAGFGGTQEEIAAYTVLGYEGAVERLVNFELVPNPVDSWIGQIGYAPIVAANQTANFYPNYVLANARGRWLFRMLYTQCPLQEKMALFWHNHFATGYSKIAGDVGPTEATRLMAAGPGDPAQQVGQIELFRAMALGNFFDLLVAVTRDPAMLYWLDGRRNVRERPQENYGREVMELFTMGVVDTSGTPNYTEDDVKAAARVFTGWNLQTTNHSASTTRTRKRLRFRSTPTAERRSRREPPRSECRTGWSSWRRSSPIPPRRHGWRRSCTSSSSTTSSPRPAP
jgi:uncharacterized protein (DUF1800 family)